MACLPLFPSFNLFRVTKFCASRDFRLHRAGGRTRLDELVPNKNRILSLFLVRAIERGANQTLARCSKKLIAQHDEDEMRLGSNCADFK